jgi:hypothetical protein
MPDPVGTQGITPRPPSTDMEVAADGGPGFMERLQSLAEVKNAADRAVRELRLGEAAKSALAKAEQLKGDAADALEKAEAMKKAAEDALVKAGQDVFDATRKVEEAREQAKAIIADANKRSADADQRLATAEQAEQDVMKERALVRAAEKEAAVVKKKFETKLANLQAGLDEILAEDAHDKRNYSR